MTYLPETGSDADRIAKLERRVAELERGNPLQAATYRTPGFITYLDENGLSRLLVGRFDTRLGLQVLDGDGNIVGEWYGQDASGTNGTRWVVRRPNGTGVVGVQTDRFTIRRSDDSVAFILDDSQIVSMTDDDFFQLLSQDTGGDGLNRPYLPLPHAPDYQTLEKTTTSATFVNVWRVEPNAQHPRVLVKCALRSISGATGEARLWDETAGVQVGSTVTINNGDYVEHEFDGVLPSGWRHTFRQLRVQLRVTNATGSVGVEVTRAYGVGSA